MRKITNLVFQGGSVKGAAYEGALKALSKRINLQDIQRVGGTSAGAITALVLAMGCNIERIDELTNDLNFRDMLDDKVGSVSTQSKVLKSIAKIDEGKHWFWAKVPSKPLKTTLLHRLINQKGIYEGEFARHWIENIICKQVHLLTKGQYKGDHLTFGELHDLTQKYPGVFRDLFVVGVNLTTEEKMVFSYNNPNTKDVIISDAVRISMSIPGLFVPHPIYYKVDGVRMIETSRNFWIDGGFYDNYPIDIFDDKAFITEGDEALKQAHDGRFYNPQTLGFRLVSGGEKGYFDGTHHDKNNAKTAKSISEYLLTLVGGSFSLQEAFYNRSENRERTVYIDHLNVSTLAFNLSDTQRQALKKSGELATQDYLDKKCVQHATHQSIADEETKPCISHKL